MGLITETNAQYYAGQQKFLSSSYPNNKFPCTFDTDLTLTVPGVSNANFKVYVAGYGNTTSAIDAVQFKFSGGNIDAGTIKLYGIKDS